jgi:excisionase family DNA binding protein
MEKGISVTVRQSIAPSDDQSKCSSKGSKLLTISDISAYLSIKQKTLYAKVESGEIPHYRIGRLVRFRLDEIDAWLEGCRKVNSPATGQHTAKIRRRSISGSTDHFSAVITKTIDVETNKYYSADHGKSDRIEGLGKEVNHGPV